MTNELIQQLLLEAGLDKNEIAIYTTLLQYGSLTYSHLTRLSKVRRTTCYAVAARLKLHGLINEDITSPVTLLIALSPHNLLGPLGKQQAQLYKRTEITKRAIAELDKTYGLEQYSEPKLSYVTEDKIEEFLYKRTETWDKSAHKHGSILWGFEASAFEQQYKKYIDWYWQQPLANTMRIKFFGDNPHGRDPNANPPGKSEFKYFPGVVNFSSNIWIYGDYVIILSLEKRPHYIIEMQEPLLAENFRSFFKAIWVTSNPTTTK